MIGAAPSTAEPGTLVAGEGFQLHGPDGIPTPAFLRAALGVALELAIGCVGGALIADLGFTTEHAMETARGAVGGDATAAELVAGLAEGVPEPVARDVAGQMVRIATEQILASAVDDCVLAGSTICLPDAPGFLIDRGSVPEIRPSEILCAVLVVTAVALRQAFKQPMPDPEAVRAYMRKRTLH